MEGALLASRGLEGGVTRFTYDDAANLLTVQDPVNNTTTYSYDVVGRLTLKTNQLDDARSFFYDSLGRTAKVLDRNERAVQFEYNAMDRVTHVKWYDDASPVPTITIATTTDGGVTDEVQRVGYSDDMGMLGGGTFTLTFDGQTTSGIAWDARKVRHPQKKGQTPRIRTAGRRDQRMEWWAGGPAEGRKEGPSGRYAAESDGPRVRRTALGSFETRHPCTLSGPLEIAGSREVGRMKRDLLQRPAY